MATQTATTPELDAAQRIVIAMSRYTQEHNTPCKSLIENFRLAKGEKSMTVPKVGQMTASDLTDGIDMVAEQSIGMTYTSLTTSEVGLKVVLTDKLVRQMNEDVFKMIGRQMGDAMARKIDDDIITLFSALNGGTTLGVDNANLTFANVTGCIGYAISNLFPKPIFIVHHPNALVQLARSAMNIVSPAGTASTYPNGYAGTKDEILRNFFAINVNGVPVFQDGNIDVIGSTASGYGCIASKSAMCYIESQAITTERERDASLRGTEVVMVSDYGVFELDDSYGAPMRYEIGDLDTSST